MGGYALVRVDVSVLWSKKIREEGKKIREEGWGVLYEEVHEKRMHHHFFNDTSFCHGSGLLVGKWHFSIYPLLEDNLWSTMVSIFFLLLISHLENL